MTQIFQASVFETWDMDGAGIGRTPFSFCQEGYGTPSGSTQSVAVTQARSHCSGWPLENRKFRLFFSPWWFLIEHHTVKQMLGTGYPHFGCRKPPSSRYDISKWPERSKSVAPWVPVPECLWFLCQHWQRCLLHVARSLQWIMVKFKHLWPRLFGDSRCDVYHCSAHHFYLSGLKERYVKDRDRQSWSSKCFQTFLPLPFCDGNPQRLKYSSGDL